MLEVLLVIGFFVLFGSIGGFVIWSFVHVRKRDGRSDQQQAELVRFVEERGWSYTPSKPGGGDRYCGSAPFPDKGVNIDVSDYITGEFRGRTFCCFEYRTRGAGTDTGDRQWRFHTVFALTTPTPVPRTSIRRPQALDRLDARMFGGGHVVELGIPAFDEEFRVITDDEPFARTLAGHLAQFLPSDPRAKNAPLQFHGSELTTWHKGRLRPDQIDPQLTFLCDVVDRLPEQAWRTA
ncbi:hypothetical protein ACH429_25275 [Streptomyces pathocidini]|uniref:DUF3137 domain-containing protein n=1 Tax=Streptomyces pathocidini TaxID=1650571 RepID=A0ABW7UXS0_9ACTN|nr:hypothetical protein [Streptomyces pathocidini]